MRRIDYPALMRRALRGLVRDVLAQVRDHGLPGNHEIVLVIRTDYPGVDLPRTVVEQHPDEVTLALRPRTFAGLEVDDDELRATLSFAGTPAQVRVPLASVIRLIDASVKLQLEIGPESPPGTGPAPVAGDAGDDRGGRTDNVVAFPSPS